MSGARLFGLPPGANFAAALLAGLEQRYGSAPPELWGRMTILVNSGRMAREVRAGFEAGPPRLLPRILPVSDVGVLTAGMAIAPAMPRTVLILHLAHLLDELTDKRPDIAPKPALFDLAESLAALIDEMEGEGVGRDVLDGIDVSGAAGHWQQSRAIVTAAYDYIARTDPRLPGSDARNRRIAEALRDLWRQQPPAHPIIVAGSTGSRGATRLLMEAVARLPNGAVVLPGFDFSMPADHWNALGKAATSEDHPQYRFRSLMDQLGLRAGDVEHWCPSHAAPDPARNAVVSLALCPAPVTDLWLAAAEGLPPLETALARVTLVEASSPRAEAAAIALRLREAVEHGQRASLITPDRELSRQVASALGRWGIEPDDSGGTPLQQTPPGRLLRMTAALMVAPPTLPELLALLKHPLAATGGDRGAHLLATRELELYLRRKAVARPDADALARFGETHEARWADWAGWVAALLHPSAATGLEDRIAAHWRLTEAVARGADGATEATGGLWDTVTGTAAHAAMKSLAEAAHAYGADMTPIAYATLLTRHLSRIPVTDPRRPHPDVMIWGTLESRAGGVDLAILAGLNDGTWPGFPGPDPWLNRTMRASAGLLSPERQVGLSAHDFQQAIAAPEVMLTRAMRDAEAPTVPSRWLNRLTTLLKGLGPDGAAALDGMRERGSVYLGYAQALESPDTPDAPESRPSPMPPPDVRPKELSVTRITTLIRDPYAIYAQYVLGLRPVAPLQPTGDARERGIALHKVMEAFLGARDAWLGDPQKAHAALDAAARVHLARLSADPAVRTLWHARLMGVAERIVAGEMQRLAAGKPVLEEREGKLDLGTPEFTLTAKPDRIDLLEDGTYAIRDYKSGTPPSPKQVETIDKQLPLEAAMAERGAFPDLPAAEVSEMTYISLGVSGEDRAIPVAIKGGGRVPDAALEGLRRLISHYARPDTGYTAQRAAEKTRFDGDYDHLSRWGEWNLTDEAVPARVGPSR